MKKSFRIFSYKIKNVRSIQVSYSLAVFQKHLVDRLICSSLMEYVVKKATTPIRKLFWNGVYQIPLLSFIFLSYLLSFAFQLCYNALENKFSNQRVF